MKRYRKENDFETGLTKKVTFFIRPDDICQSARNERCIYCNKIVTT